MGWSFVKFGDDGELAKDSDLMVMVALMEEAVLRDPHRFACVASAVREWQDYLPTTGPGTILLYLDDLVAEAGPRDELVALLSAVEGVLVEFGDAVPGEWIAQRCRVRDVGWGDYEGRWVRGVLDQVRSLLRRHGALTTDD